ncbi:MAG TPA: nuclear transport factor 2 family protein [Gaiellaceae bacterium]|nr:nuclear transport factor 2 family protein [Gaiellaceae bacterium]
MNVTERVLAAINAHDLDSFVACYAEDATIEDGYDTVGVSGHEQLRTIYGPMFEQFPEINVEPLGQAIRQGEFVVQHERVTGRGEPTQHVAVYLVRDDRIVRERLLR